MTSDEKNAIQLLISNVDGSGFLKLDEIVLKVAEWRKDFSEEKKIMLSQLLENCEILSEGELKASYIAEKVIFELNDKIYASDKILLEMLIPYVPNLEKVIVSLLMWNRYDCLDSVKNLQYSDEQKIKVLMCVESPNNYYKNDVEFYKKEKSLIEKDFLTYVQVIKDNTSVLSQDTKNLWTNMLVYFRELLDNKIVHENKEYSLLTYMSVVADIEMDFAYSKKIKEDILKDLVQNQRFIKGEYVKYMPIVEIKKIKNKVLEEEVFNSLIQREYKNDIERDFIFLQNLDYMLTTVDYIKCEDYESIEKHILIAKLQHISIYFLFVELKNRWKKKNVSEMMDFLRKDENFKHIEKYLPFKNHLMKEPFWNAVEPILEKLDKQLAQIEIERPVFDMETLTFVKIESYELLNEYAIKKEVNLTNKGEDWVTKAIKTISNLLSNISGFLDYQKVMKNFTEIEGKLSPKQNDENEVKNEEVSYNIFTEQSENDFMITYEKSENDVIKRAKENLKDKKYKMSRGIALAQDLLNKIDIIYEQFPHFEQVTEHIEDVLRMQLKGNGMFYIPPLLLAGGAGVGKTYYVSTISKMVDTYLTMISYQNVTANFVLIGSSHQWGNASPGIVFNTLMNKKCHTINPIILLDEVDKNGSGRGYSTEDCLLGLLEKHTAKEFADECIPLKIDASHISWLGTANNVERLSAPLKNRFDVMDIPMPNIKQKRVLVANIYNGVIQGNEWGVYMNQVLPEDTVDKLVHVLNGGVSRDLRKLITKSCAKAIREDNNTLLPQHIIFQEEARLPWDEQR